MLPKYRAAASIAPDKAGPDAFALLTAASHQAATSPWSAHADPTAAQAAANVYKVGRMVWHGLPIRIENPAHSIREGADPGGKPWRNMMQAAYGDFAGTKGADGDFVDLFMGPFPESRRVWVLNQRAADGSFDEHKVLCGFVDEAAALSAYRYSYSPGWNRGGPATRITLDQLKWWLKWADTTRPFSLDLIPPEPDMTDDTLAPAAPDLTRVFWDSAAQPMGKTIAEVLYLCRANDGADGLILDPMTMGELMAGEEVIRMDALTVLVGKLEPQMRAMMRVMEAAGADVKPLAFQLSEPVRRHGGVHVAALFELSDGQTITIWFHNPDLTPAKLSIADTLVSWKWLLNKKDITIVVAPESGSDLNSREVARRLMRLAAKNSAAFARVNAKRAATMAEIEGLKTTLAAKQEELAGLVGQIEVAKVAQSDRLTAEQDAWLAKRLDSDGIRAVAESMGFKATVYGVMGKGGAGHIDVWKAGMPASEKIGIDIESDPKSGRKTQFYRVLGAGGMGSTDLREVLQSLEPVAGPASDDAELVKVMTVFGKNTYVRRGDMQGDENATIRMFTAEGKNNGRIARGNLDPDGSKRAASAAEDANNPMFNVITARGGNTFATAAAATRELNARGMQQTHEVVPADQVAAGLAGFLVRKKAPAPAADPSPAEGAASVMAPAMARLAELGWSVDPTGQSAAKTFMGVAADGELSSGGRELTASINGTSVELHIGFEAIGAPLRAELAAAGDSINAMAEKWAASQRVALKPTPVTDPSDRWRKVSASDHRITDLTGQEWTVARVGSKWLTEAGQSFPDLNAAKLAVEDGIAAVARNAAAEAASRASVAQFTVWKAEVIRTAAEAMGDAEAAAAFEAKRDELYAKFTAGEGAASAALFLIESAPAEPEVYPFATATEEARALLAIGATNPSRSSAYNTAVSLEKAAADLGLTIAWESTDTLPTFDAPAMDSADGDADDEGEDFDPEEEFANMPEDEEEEEEEGAAA
jgi:hypothetical protein